MNQDASVQILCLCFVPTRPLGNHPGVGELHQLHHWENYEYLYKILFFIWGGHQSVRDRTAQAGAPFLNSLAFIRRKCGLDLLDCWI